ncbi:enoyl-CoA hydratase/isomerase family protein, partial [bacterium]|nr:enoyl-CoA hydratase/isomerase family protein [bacterium]
ALSGFEEGADYPLRYTVFGSKIPGVYNLGGDLPLFARMIRSSDREGLRRYAYACVEPLHFRAVNLGLPVIGISLVQGDALGGGFECALADDVIIAERSAKFGLPEILFNLFPGMGAYSFLSRRISPAQAERMMLSGRIYSAEELYEMGVVDMVAEDGAGEDAVYDYVERVDRVFEG